MWPLYQPQAPYVKNNAAARARDMKWLKQTSYIKCVRLIDWRTTLPSAAISSRSTYEHLDARWIARYSN